MNWRSGIKIIFIFIVLISVQKSIYAKDIWHQVKTKNFTLIGNAKEKQIKQVGIKLEQFRESIKRLVPTLSKNSPIQTTVIVFKDDKAFHPYKPKNSKGETTNWVAGYFQAGFDVNYIALAFENKGADAFQTIFHEYTHNLIDYNLGRKNLPTWLAEGLAEYYDQFDVKNDQIVSFGSRNNSHIKLLNEQTLIPLDKFFAIDYKSLRLKSQAEANLFYSQAWAITHFFMQGQQGKRKKDLHRFLRLVSKGTSVDEALKEIFQMSITELHTKLIFHIKSSYINIKPTKFDKKLTGEIKIESHILPKANVYAILGDLLYQRKKYVESEKLLAKALKLDPGSSFANATFGMLRMKQQKFAEAGRFLKRAIDSKEASYLTLYRNAYFLSREVLSMDAFISNYSDERTAEMRKSLEKSILLNPNFPDSYRLLGFINLVRNEKLDEGISYLKKALEITPNNQTYLLYLAHLYQRNKDFENAKIIAGVITKNPYDEDIFSRATSILVDIKQIESEFELANQSEKLKKIQPENTNIKTKSAKRRVLSEWELEQNRRQTESEIISEVLRKPKAGEKRIVGQISKVACVDDLLVLVVEVNDHITKLQSSSSSNINLKTYTSKMRNGSFGCNLNNEGVYAVLIYRPIKKNPSNILGDLISIEFVPNNFVLANEK